MKTQLEDAVKDANLWKERTTQTEISRLATATAMELNFHNPAKIDRLVNLSDVVTENGIDEAKIKERLEALAKSDPYLIKQAQPATPGNFGPTNPPGTIYPRQQFTNNNAVDLLKKPNESFRLGQIAEGRNLAHRAWDIKNPKST